MDDFFSIDAIAERVATQDNAITADPVFEVRTGKPSSRNPCVIATCFTRGAAEAFMRREAHNHPPMHIYVGSAHRNPEIKAIRAMLLEHAGRRKGSDAKDD